MELCSLPTFCGDGRERKKCSGEVSVVTSSASYCLHSECTFPHDLPEHSDMRRLLAKGGILSQCWCYERQVSFPCVIVQHVAAASICMSASRTLLPATGCPVFSARKVMCLHTDITSLVPVVIVCLINHFHQKHFLSWLPRCISFIRKVLVLLPCT